LFSQICFAGFHKYFLLTSNIFHQPNFIVFPHKTNIHTPDNGIYDHRNVSIKLHVKFSLFSLSFVSKSSNVIADDIHNILACHLEKIEFFIASQINHLVFIHTFQKSKLFSLTLSKFCFKTFFIISGFSLKNSFISSFVKVSCDFVSLLYFFIFHS
jgi:hypothetical protein